MEQITLTINLYSFEELSDEAKQHAIEEYHDINTDHDWWDCSFEQFAEVAELFGLDIRQTRKNLINGDFRYDPTIYFSGFASQGDGACFEGRYSYKEGALKNIKKEWPQDKELHQIVASLQELQRRNFYQVHCRTKQSGHYMHSGCMQVDVEHAEDSYRQVAGEDDFIQCMRNFADWIYSKLEKEHDYLTSDEQIKESLIANEYKFTENGEIY
ncbi:hypothetical protein JWJ90_13175 [Desulfobulbus rhabdoformis]|uniref:hypothetical protein n=1 Tax=Desulfobulbus rhabdoformis TaxID=34032 RepID=UPI001965C888|nr:hypothetical protein [Desulfobulbus rhabdoformis]MBM9615232.1 hypothetical protein [Desulfobulbus rhabdoformis]